MSEPTSEGPQRTLQAIRRVLQLLLLVAFVGTFVELLLLEHDDGPTQMIPLVLLVAGTVALLATALRPRPAVVTIFRVVMALLIAGAALGLGLHFQANIEFQRDLAPDDPFTEWFWRALAAKTPPALAPAVLAQLGCLGLIYAYRLPVREPVHADEGGHDVAIH